MRTQRGVQRGNHSFRVVETPSTASWNFWGLFANSTWEKSTFQALDEVLNEGDLLFDVGAWVGPIALWEAKRGIKVIAFEPDASAFEVLQENIQLNNLGEMITPVQIALVESERTVSLFFYEPGDSKSRVWNQIFDNSMQVSGDTLSKMVETYGVPKAVKMDIEGGESLVLPEAGPLLRANGVSLVLSLHTIWYPDGTADAINEELSHWDMRDLSHENYLCTPKEIE